MKLLEPLRSLPRLARACGSRKTAQDPLVIPGVVAGCEDQGMASTPARQRNAVSEGMALGLILSGHASIPFDKVAIDLAFEGAFRSWRYADRFPQVGTDLRNGSDGVWVMTRATEGKQVWVLFWDTAGRELRIFARQHDWDPNDEEDVEYALSVIDGDVPREGWLSLAQDFLKDLPA